MFLILVGWEQGAGLVSRSTKGGCEFRQGQAKDMVKALAYLLEVWWRAANQKQVEGMVSLTMSLKIYLARLTDLLGTFLSCCKLLDGFVLTWDRGDFLRPLFGHAFLRIYGQIHMFDLLKAVYYLTIHRICSKSMIWNREKVSRYVKGKQNSF